MFEKLKAALAEDNVLSILNQRWPYLKNRGLILKDCRVVRVFQRDWKDFVIEYEMTFDGKEGLTACLMLGELVGDEAEKHYSEVLHKLAKIKVAQISKDESSDLVACFADLGLVLRFYELDERIHGLKTALDPAVIKPVLQKFITHDCDRPELRVELLSHRLGKRCTVKYHVECQCPGVNHKNAHSLVGKIYKSRSDRVSQVYDETKALWNQGFNVDAGDGIRIPRPLGYMPDLQLLVMEKVPGQPCTEFSGRETGLAVELAARALAKLHKCSSNVSLRYMPSDEVELLENWVKIVSQVYPDMAHGLREALITVQNAIVRHKEFEPALVHRDFHEKQVLVEGSKVSIIDFDTLCLSDPAIDIGNFLAHLKLVRLQGFLNVDNLEQNFLKAYSQTLSGEFLARIETYTKSTFLRLACIYSLRPKCRELAGKLLNLCGNCRF